MSPTDPETLAAALNRLADQGGDVDVLQSLRVTVETCAGLFGVTGSGLQLVDQQNVQRYVVASDEPGRVLETAETETGQGPCTDALVLNRIVTTDDVRADDRWPELTRRVDGVPVRAISGVPVRVGGVPVGSLNLYRDRPHRWEAAQERGFEQYARVVSSILSSAMQAARTGDLVDQLRYALDYRIVIERGVGYLMADRGVDAVQAFNLLRTAARRNRRKVGDVAEDLLAKGRLAP